MTIYNKHITLYRQTGMEIAIEDQKLNVLKHQIQCRQRMMIERFKTVRDSVKENTLLAGVLEDYKKYYQDLIASKRAQAEALMLLRDYLESMEQAINLSDVQMEYLKHERSETINRLQDVREEMKRLLDETESS